jgi:hypothetical protein
MIPFLLIVGTVASFIGYFQILGASTGTALSLADQNRWTYTEKDKVSDFKTGSEVLRHWDDRPIPYSFLLQMLYLAIFLSAECAFVLMALREYINDTRRVSELEWMFGKQDAKALTEMQESIQARLRSEADLELRTPLREEHRVK